MRKLVDRSQLPPFWAVVIVIILFVAVEASAIAGRLGLGLPVDVTTTRTFLVLAATLCLAAWRAFSHPFFHRKYCHWLASTPWEPSQRIPLCCLRPHYQDIAWMAMLALASQDVAAFALTIPIWFTFVYATVIAMALLSVGTWKHGYLLMYGLGLLVWCHQHPITSVAAAVGLYLVAHFGIRESLNSFPWTTTNLPLSGYETHKKESIIGWPFTSLQSTPTTRYADIRLWPHGLFAAALPGYYFAIAWSFLGADYPSKLFLPSICQIVLAAIVMRLIFFLAGHSPLLLGRIASGQWFVPRFDQVFVTPLLISVGAPVLAIILVAIGVSKATTLGAIFSVCCGLVLAGPPSYEHWHLTSASRLCGGRNSSR